MKTEIYDCPSLTAPNFNRAGGLMTVTYNGNKVRVVQEMPNPASDNLPSIVINDCEMDLEDFNTWMVPSFTRLGVKLVETRGEIAPTSPNFENTDIAFLMRD